MTPAQAVSLAGHRAHRIGFGDTQLPGVWPFGLLRIGGAALAEAHAAA